MPKTNRECLTEKRFGEWRVLEDRGTTCYCECSCGTKKEIYTKNLLNGLSKKCKNHNSIKGKKINHWTVIEELGQGKVLCECDCIDKTRRVLYKKSLISGQTKSCGCSKQEYIDISGKAFGNWKVLRYLGNELWECECQCSNKTIRNITKHSLIYGVSRSCGCLQSENMKNTLIERYGETNTSKIANPREKWQIDIVSSKDNFINYLKGFEKKPTVNDLTVKLGIGCSTVLCKIHQFGLDEYVDIKPLHSKEEDEVFEYVNTLCNKYNYSVLRGVRGKIGQMELDIYIPEIELAIEFNGNYWHSDLYKDKKYHQKKSSLCKLNNIHLVHIFEYEWISNKDKVKNYISDLIHCEEKIYARNTEVKDISSEVAYDFENQYHLQGRCNSSVNIGCYHNNDLVGVMTFGIPRFNKSYQYELIRLCFKTKTNVVGASNKMFKYFINKYKPNSVVSYCNMSKFNGNVYKSLGFELKEVSEPNYVWVEPNSCSVLTRYKTQKHKLLEKGFGNTEQTEDEIMKALNYLKIYDSGNYVYVYTDSN